MCRRRRRGRHPPLEKDEARFDVVFSDAAMPGVSGVELRGDPAAVLLASGDGDLRLQPRVGRGGPARHKPYAVENVSRVLRRVTRRNGAG